MISLDRIAFVDCEASSLRCGSYPIEIGWCLPDTGEVRSTLIRPVTDWYDWDPDAAAIHRITRGELLASGQPVALVARTFGHAVTGRTVYADSSLDDRWIRRLFAAAEIDWPLKIEPFEKLLDAAVRPDTYLASRGLARDLARAELQGALIDAAFAKASEVAPKRHRAGADAYHLWVVLREALRLADGPR